MIRSSRDSAPGTDSLPYRAWLAGKAFVDVLWHGTLWVLGGGFLPSETTEVLTVYAPKGELPEDGEKSGVTRSARALRPLGLKTTSCKAICGVLNVAIVDTVDKLAAPIQRGFVRGRQFLSNLV